MATFHVSRRPGREIVNKFEDFTLSFKKAGFNLTNCLSRTGLTKGIVMTRKQFETFRLAVEKEKFAKAVADPILYGIERTVFRRQKLEKLIRAGKNVKSRTVQSKVQRWIRQLGRLQNSQTHLEQ